jgi:hypothetical protein
MSDESLTRKEKDAMANQEAISLRLANDRLRQTEERLILENEVLQGLVLRKEKLLTDLRTTLNQALAENVAINEEIERILAPRGAEVIAY